jgi:uncharacterized membrane protein YbhN (UPF0104 family)
MTDQEPSAAKPRSRFRLIIQTTVLLVVGIFYYLLKGIDLGHVWAEIQAMTWTEDAALAAIAAWNLATYGLVWMSVTPGLGFRRAMVMTQAASAVTTTAPYRRAGHRSWPDLQHARIPRLLAVPGTGGA